MDSQHVVANLYYENSRRRTAQLLWSRVVSLLSVFFCHNLVAALPDHVITEETHLSTFAHFVHDHSSWSVFTITVTLLSVYALICIWKIKRKLEITLSQHNNTLSEAETRLQSIMDNVYAAIISADENGIIQDVNKHSEKLLGYRKNELIGKNVKQLVPEPYRSRHDDSIRRYNNGGAPSLLGKTRELYCQRKDGTIFPVEITLTNINGTGRITYIALIYDITARKQSEDQLKTSEERFKRSQTFANIGTWDWDIRSGALYWSERIPALFGYPNGRLDTTYENFLNAVHPDDRQKVIDAVNACVEQDVDYQIEHRCIWPDGSIHWLLEQGDVTRDKNGQPLHMLGVVSDVTERKLLEDNLDRQKQLLAMLRATMSYYVSSGNFSETCKLLLDSLLDISHSEYGFMGEILNSDSDEPQLKIHAISSVTDENIPEQPGADGIMNAMSFVRKESLYGHVLTTGKLVISNSPFQDPRSSGQPEGHPVIDNFMGVPVYYGKKLVGIYCIANHPGGYDDSLHEFLHPFTSTYSSIIHAQRLTEKQQSMLSQLIATKEDAEQANLAKSEFLSRMSHELRTPLNAILGFTQLIDMGHNTAKLTHEQQDYINEIKSAGSHLLDLVNDVLDISRIESGHFELAIKPCHLKDIIDECRGMIVQLAESSRIQLDFDTSCATDTVIECDRTRLKQAITNLLTNAVKYNYPGGTIQMHCDKNDAEQTIRISISNTGRGIPKERLHEVFESFNRLDADQTDVEGTGIGLVIAKTIIEKMGGTIGVHSDTGENTTFWFTLRCAAPTDELPQLSTIQDAAAETADTGSEQKYTILYIEDNPANLKLIEGLLKQRSDITLLTATKPSIGFACLEQQAVDLILLDISLPEMNGFQVLHYLRNNGLIDNNLPVIAISANAMPSDIQAGLDAGFSDYLSKPFDISNFLALLDRYLSK